eukprot:ANDGO_03911.mRNA.1 mRNA decapping complex subunit 2
MSQRAPLLSDVFEDLSARFIVNCPQEDLDSNERLCFVIETAHWYYEDFYREQYPSLPPMKFTDFCVKFFAACPLLRPHVHMVSDIVGDFHAYKSAIPVCGAILLNEACDKILLVSSYSKKNSWGFPRGKIAKDECEMECAIREVDEEIGFDVRPYVKEDMYVEKFVLAHMVRLYLCVGVPESTRFQTRTRKEIAEIQWHPIASLPRLNNKFHQSGPERKKSVQYYLCFPFLRDLYEFLEQQVGRVTPNKRRPDATTGGSIAKKNGNGNGRSPAPGSGKSKGSRQTANSTMLPAHSTYSMPRSSPLHAPPGVAVVCDAASLEASLLSTSSQSISSSHLDGTPVSIADLFSAFSPPRDAPDLSNMSMNQNAFTHHSDGLPIPFPGPPMAYSATAIEAAALGTSPTSPVPVSIPIAGTAAPTTPGQATLSPPPPSSMSKKSSLGSFSFNRDLLFEDAIEA